MIQIRTNSSKFYPNPKDYDKQITISIDKTLGYAYFCDVNHPLVNSQGKVYAHRHLASVKEGRWINKDEDVHHIDHNKSNNEFSNLQVVTKQQHRHIHLLEKGCILTEVVECKNCGKEFKQLVNTQNYCSHSCSSTGIQGKVEISKEVLEKLVWELPTIKIAEMFNMSDVAIGKRCKKMGITKPPRGYWAKEYSKD